MKLSTSIRNAKQISNFLKSLGGIVGTPHTQYRAFKITRAWLFGSTAKGNPNPNDTDILIEGFEVGERMYDIKAWTTEQQREKLSTKRWSTKKNKPMMGIRFPMESRAEACKSMRGNRKMVRIHDAKYVGELGDIPETKIMIYPIWSVGDAK